MSSVAKRIVSGKERKQLIEELQERVESIPEILPKKLQLAKYIHSKSIAIIADNKDPLLIEMDDKIFPHLKLIRRLDHTYPIIKVDTGAIRFVTNGADVMRPGVTHIDGLVLEGDLVLIVEDTKDAALAFGIALYDAVDMNAMEGGKCIKNLHYLKDKYWEIED